MAAFRGASITFALLAAIIGTIALLSSPAVTADWWSDDVNNQPWCQSCMSLYYNKACQWKASCGGDHVGDWYCATVSYFQSYYPQCWENCQAPCGEE